MIGVMAGQMCPRELGRYRSGHYIRGARLSMILQSHFISVRTLIGEVFEHRRRRITGSTRGQFGVAAGNSNRLYPGNRIPLREDEARRNCEIPACGCELARIAMK